MAFAEQARAMKTLLAAEMWDSAEALGGFLCSASGGSDVAASADHARHLSLLGDALLGKREHRRALNAFRQALSVNRLAPKVPAGNDNGSAIDDGHARDPRDARAHAVHPGRHDHPALRRWYHQR